MKHRITCLMNSHSQSVAQFSKKKKKKKGSKHWYTYYILLRDEWKWKVPIPPQPPQLLPLAWYYFKPFSKYPDCQKCCSAPLVHTCTQGRQLGPHRSRAATGGSLMKRSGPVWKQRGCAVAQTHGTELMETPPSAPPQHAALCTDRMKVLNSDHTPGAAAWAAQTSTAAPTPVFFCALRYHGCTAESIFYFLVI